MRTFLIIAGAVLLLLGAWWGYVLYYAPAPAPPPAAAPTEEAPLPHVEEIGTSVEGRSIEAHTFGSGSTRLLFVGGIHGGYEWNSVLLAYEVIDYFTSFPDSIPDTLSVTVIPVLNPDGLYAVGGVEGRFTASDMPASRHATIPGRFNARGVDLNRNFDCRWQPESRWRGQTVSAGSAPFSEPEAAALRSEVAAHTPAVAVFWHSRSNAVYASECEAGILPETLAVMEVYAKAAGYPSVLLFDHYPITGDAEGWLATQGVPAITVELETHNTTEWERNRKGIEALIAHIARSGTQDDR